MEAARNGQTPETNVAEVYRFLNALHRSDAQKVTFTDPLTGEDLSPNSMPAFLSRDQELRQGQEFLSEFADRLDIQIVFAHHHPGNAAALGDEQFGFEGRVGDSDLLLLEGFGWNQRQKELYNKLSAGGMAPEEFDELISTYTAYLDEAGNRKAGGAYNVRKLNAIANARVAVSFFDVENKSDPHHIRKSLLAADEVGSSLAANARAVDAGGVVTDDRTEAAKTRDIFRTIGIAALESLREWVMVANTGYQIMKFVSESPAVIEKIRNQEIHVLLVAGDAHRDLERKFSTLGVAVAVAPATADVSQTTEQIPRWLAQCYIPKQELK